MWAAMNLEDGNERRRGLQERLVGVGPEWSQRREPLRRGTPRAELTLFGLGRRPQPRSYAEVGNDHESPRLHVRAARRRGGDPDCLLQHTVRDGPVVKVANRTSPAQVVRERTHTSQRLRIRYAESGAATLGRVPGVVIAIRLTLTGAGCRAVEPTLEQTSPRRCRMARRQ